MHNEPSQPAGIDPSAAQHAFWIDTLTLHTLDPDRDGDVAIASIPLPKDDHTLVAFAGMAS